jgi:hypothetical protein
MKPIPALFNQNVGAVPCAVWTANERVDDQFVGDIARASNDFTAAGPLAPAVALRNGAS